MDKTKAQMAAFRSSMTKSLAGIGAAVAAIGVSFAIGDMIKDAAKTEAAVGQLNRLMGDSATEFENWAKTSSASFGMSRNEAIQFGSTYANLISNFSSDTAQTTKYTQDLLKESAVVASATGRTMEDVMDRIRSGMLGNTEAIEDLGINVNVSMIQSTKAFQQFANGKSWDQLSFQVKQQIMYFGILEQATSKYGTELADNTQTKINQFTASLKNLKGAFGDAFLPIVNAVLPSLTAFIQKLSEAMAFVAAFTKALFGSSSKEAQKQEQAISGVSSAYQDAGDSAKQAAKDQKGFLSGFDEVNAVPDKKVAAGSTDTGKGGQGAGAGAGSVGNIDSGPITAGMDSINQKAKEMADSVKNAFGQMSEFIAQHKELIIAALVGLGTGFVTYKLIIEGTAIATRGLTVATAALEAVIAILASPILAIAALVAALTAAVVYFYETNETFRGKVDSIFTAIGDALKIVYEQILIPVGDFLVKTFAVAWDAVSTAANWLYLNVLTPFGTFLTEFYNTVISPLADILNEGLAIAFQAVSDIAYDFWQTVMIPLGDFFKDTFQPLIEALSAVFGTWWEKVLKPLGEFIGKTFLLVWQDLVKILKELWNNVLKPLETYLLSGFKDAFHTVFTGIGKIIDGVKTSVKGVLEFITGVFKGDWEKAWNGLSSIVEGIFKSLDGLVKTPINLIIDGINKMIKGLNSISIDIPDWVPGFGGKKFGINIPTIPKLAQGGIVDSPTMAMIGEAGKEMVVPLENTSFTDKLAGALGTAVMSAMQIGNGGGLNTTNNSNREVVLKIDGYTIARALNPYLTKESGRVGNALIKIT